MLLPCDHAFAEFLANLNPHLADIEYKKRLAVAALTEYPVNDRRHVQAVRYENETEHLAKVLAGTDVDIRPASMTFERALEIALACTHEHRIDDAA